MDGKERQESSFLAFRNFIDEIEMGDIYTWANNKERVEFIQERLDRLYGSVEQMLLNDNTVVNHVFRPTSDHSIIILDSKPDRVRTRAKFVFESSWTKEEECKEIVNGAWEKIMTGSRMFRVKKS